MTTGFRTYTGLNAHLFYAKNKALVWGVMVHAAFLTIITAALFISTIKRKQVQEKLQFKENLLRLMTGSSPLAFLVVDDRTGSLLYFNRRFCEIWGIEYLEEQMERGEIKNKDKLLFEDRE